MGTTGSGCGNEGSDTAGDRRQLQTPLRHTRPRDHRSISLTPAYTHMHGGHTRATVAASMVRLRRWVVAQTSAPTGSTAGLEPRTNRALVQVTLSWCSSLGTTAADRQLHIASAPPSPCGCRRPRTGNKLVGQQTGHHRRGGEHRGARKPQQRQGGQQAITVGTRKHGLDPCGRSGHRPRWLSATKTLNNTTSLQHTWPTFSYKRLCKGGDRRDMAGILTRSNRPLVFEQESQQPRNGRGSFWTWPRR